MDLSPAKTTWKIKVKIIHLWRQYSAGDIDSIEMVLIDSNGDTIQATVNEDVVPIFESFLEEDIMGQIVEVTHVEIVSLNGKDTEKISLLLKNEEDVRLPLVVWGKVALDLSEEIQLLSDRTLICVMKFVKIKVWKEVEAFAKLLPKENISLAIVQSKPLFMVSMMSEEEEYFVKTPQKTISDILETRKVERCYVRCTIAAIDNDMGWYYISCKLCGTKLDMLHNNVNPGGTYELDVCCMLYCTKCKMLNPKLKLREIELKEDDWVEILNFDIRYVFELHRTTKHKYTIKFNESSLFRKIQPVNGSNFLCCANFRGIKRGLYHPMYCVDLCGALVLAGDLIATKLAQPANIYISILYSLEFSLINLRCTHIQCVAYGALAHRLNAFWRANTADVVVTVLRLWRIEWGEGGFNYVTNMEGGSDILFDSNILEIQFFKSQIPSIDF
uniref:Replication protein A 70 kDa DNA-binding subunit B/D first OB fold domain-containing protein n=1 Tax=Brassica oleracea var. oleracea TaxID=109376 RepID=A0A0D3E4R5_BRAOL